MFGVVLWSDTADRKAVIWCEDHGDLAFYHQPENDPSDLALDPGDLVRFEVTVDRHLRRAHNPRLVSEGAYASLPDNLGPIMADDGLNVSARESARIIPFAARPDSAEDERQVVSLKALDAG